MAKRSVRNVDEFVRLMTSESFRYLPAKELRRAIDKTDYIKQRILLQGEYMDKLEEFDKIAREALKSNGEKSMFEFEGQKYQARAAVRTAAAVKNRKDASVGRANFREQHRMIARLFPKLVQGQELGHKNISVLKASVALVLDKLGKTDPRRAALKAMFLVLQEIDKVVDPKEATLENVLAQVDNAIRAGVDIKVDYKKVVNLLSATAKGNIELEFEPRNLNQLKGRLSSLVGQVFKDVLEGNMKALESLLGGIEYENIQGSPSIKQDLTKQLVDLIDPKKTAKKSSSSTSRKGATKGPKLPLTKRRKPRKYSAMPKPGRTEGGVSASPLALISMFNQQLPTVLQKNMIGDRLNNRTGRFANSVKVTEVQYTPQGFPSFGYMYNSDYRTFEVGNKQGSIDRDPRKLIEMSMREIAAQVAIGRFYTRRL